MPILGESANPLPIHLSNANSVPICQSITNLPIHHQSANPSPIQESNANPRQICKSITNLPIHRQSMSICQSITNPPIIDQSRVYHTVQCQPNPSPIHQSFTNLPVHVQPTRSINRASAIIHPTVSTGDNQIIPIGTRLTMVVPIPDQSELQTPVRGTSTIRSQLLSGRHPICQSNVNPVSIIHQSEDNCPSNLGTSVLYEPTEVSRRRTIQTIHFRRDATPAPIIFCHSANIDQSANPMSIRG